MRLLVTGASRGIGAAVARDRVAAGDQVIALSRGPSRAGSWLSEDLASPGMAARVAAAVAGPLDALIHVAGIWEGHAFSTSYDFEASPEAEIRQIIEVNLTAPILLTQALLPALASAAPAGRVILIGSTSGLPDIGTPEVAYNASKAGLAGAAEAMSVALAGRGIGVALISPGDVQTDPAEPVPGGLALSELTAAALAAPAGPGFSHMVLRPPRG